MQHFMLTADGRVCVGAEPATLALLRRWLPLNAQPIADDAGHAEILLCVRAAPAGVPAPPEPLAAATARIGRTELRVTGDTAYAAGAGARGVAYLADGRADVELDTAATDVDVLHVMNFVVALLLARSGRWLVHAAAVAHGDAAWLLAGDAYTGKTTTTLNLARAGWRLLSDDHVLLARGEDGWQVEGWPRMLHVDEGWPHGPPTGRRVPRDPRSLTGVALAPTGTLHGVLLPCVARAAAATRLTRVSGATSLAAMLRQSAWSIADSAAAPATMAALAEVAALPCYGIELALDTFDDPRLLEERVLAALAALR